MPQNLLQGIVSRVCGGWLGKYEIPRADHQEGQAGSLGHGVKLLSTGGISSSSGSPHLCSEGLSND